jgi:hypothetical protein
MHKFTFNLFVSFVNEFSNIQSLTYVEVDKFAQRAMSDIEFMKELLDIGKQSTENYILQIEKAIDEQDSEHFRDLAHTLKGNTDLLGMLNIGKILRVWINNGKQGVVPNKEEVIEVKDAINECFITLEEFINNTK